MDQYRAALKPQSRPEKAVLQAAMGLEGHHPTDVLARYMEDVGRTRPGVCFTPHHIVQGKGNTRLASEARVNLHYRGIRINDPDNGVWMPRHIKDKGHPKMREAYAHSEIHTYNYEHWVHAETNNVPSEQIMRDKLDKVRTLLRAGKQPDYVTEPPIDETRIA